MQWISLIILRIVGNIFIVFVLLISCFYSWSTAKKKIFLDIFLYQQAMVDFR